MSDGLFHGLLHMIRILLSQLLSMGVKTKVVLIKHGIIGQYQMVLGLHLALQEVCEVLGVLLEVELLVVLQGGLLRLLLMFDYRCVDLLYFP